MTRRFILATASVLATGMGLGAMAPDSAIPRYAQTQNVGGQVRISAGAAADSVVDGWSTGLREHQPDVTTEITESRSDAAFAALIAGNTDLVISSRQINEAERESFRRRHGREAVSVAIAVDALAIYVNKNNPVTQLTMPQLDAIFSATRKRGGSAVETWGDVGVEGAWASKRIVRYGSNPDAGGAAYFRNVVLQGGEYHEDVRLQVGPGGVVNGVGAEPGGVGYAGVRRKTQRTRIVPIVVDGGRSVSPSIDTALDGSYPLAGKMYATVNAGADGSMSPAVREFLSFALSREGQAVVDREGLFSLPANLVREERGKVR